MLTAMESMVSTHTILMDIGASMVHTAMATEAIPRAITEILMTHQ